MKRAALFLLMVFSTATLVSAIDDPSLYPPDIRRIKERGKLIVAMYRRDVMPFVFHDAAGALVGHDVELARSIAEALGVPVDLNRETTTFNEIIDLVAAGEADLGISLISRTLSRARKVLFSRPYIVLRPTLLINRLAISRYGIDLASPVASLQKLRGRMAEKKGTSYVGIAAKIFPNMEIVEYPEWEDAMGAVLRGEVVAALRDEIGVKNYMAESPQQAIQLQMIVLAEPRYADPLAIAVRPDSPHLLEWINLYLEEKGTTGDADHLLRMYKKYYE